MSILRAIGNTVFGGITGTIVGALTGGGLMSAPLALLGGVMGAASGLLTSTVAGKATTWGISGTLIGGVAGFFLGGGPVGAAIGGVVGGIGGLIANKIFGGHSKEPEQTASIPPQGQIMKIHGQDVFVTPAVYRGNVPEKSGFLGL